MFHKRSETEIIYDLLSAAKKDIKKTRLMYKTNMTYTQFIKYLDVLMEKGLLAQKDTNPRGKIYYTTEDGQKLLESLHTALNYLK